jgi:hypothetical protein
MVPGAAGKSYLYELTATARMMDAFGGTANIQHPVWSHVFTNETAAGLVEVVLSVVAAEAGMPANELKEASLKYSRMIGGREMPGSGELA